MGDAIPSGSTRRRRRGVAWQLRVCGPSLLDRSASNLARLRSSVCAHADGPGRALRRWGFGRMRATCDRGL